MGCSPEFRRPIPANSPEAVAVKSAIRSPRCSTFDPIDPRTPPRRRALRQGGVPTGPSLGGAGGGPPAPILTTRPDPIPRRLGRLDLRCGPGTGGFYAIANYIGHRVVPRRLGSDPTTFFGRYPMKLAQLGSNDGPPPKILGVVDVFSARRVASATQGRPLSVGAFSYLSLTGYTSAGRAEGVSPGRAAVGSAIRKATCGTFCAGAQSP